MKNTLARLQRIEDWILVASFTIMVAAFFVQVVNRNFLHLSLPWLEELAVFSMIYLVMLGTEAGLRDGTQIRITAVVDRLKGHTRTIVLVFAKLVVVLFSLAMLWASINIVMQQLGTGQTSAALQVPMWLPYFAFVLAFAIIVVAQSVAAFLLLRELFAGQKPTSELGGKDVAR